MVSIVESVIAVAHHDKLVERIRHNNFSIIVDESTDLSSTKTLAVVVRVMDKTMFCAKDLFYTSIEVECADHVTLYNAIVAEFIKDKINYKERLKGFASDGTSVMMGKTNSVMRKLK